MTSLENSRPSITACFVVDRRARWPLDPVLWEAIERLCDRWLIVVAGSEEGVAAPDAAPADLCGRLEGSIITCAIEEDPWQAALVAARESTSHLWLLDPSSIVLASLVSEFSGLQEGNFIAHGINARELQWRRTLISTSRSWRYSPINEQWEPREGNACDGYIHRLKIQLDYSPQRRHEEAVERKAASLSRLDSGAEDSFEYMQLGQSFEALDDRPSAAAWYHRGAQRHDAASAYCRYRYWYLVQEMSDSVSAEERQQAWLALFDEWPHRAEPLFQLIQCYIDSEDWDKAWSLVEIALEIETPGDAMPFEGWIYTYGLFYQAAQCARARQDDENVLRHTISALRYEYLPEKQKLQLFAWQTESYERSLPKFAVSRNETNQFVVIIPFRNCADFLQACIDSLKIQRYRHFRVVFIDDASTDGGLSQCDLAGLPAYIIIQREQRREALGNQVDALLNYCDPLDIAVFLDGDDRLADESVLEYLNTVYNQSGCWLTYGQFSFNDSAVQGYARPVLDTESVAELFLQNGLRFPIHLRSHRAGLILELMKQDPDLDCLKGADGRFIQCASDVAHMRAMLVITPRDRVRYIPRILYRYNTNNPGSHFQSSRKKLQLEECIRIGHRPVLETVDRFSPYAPGCGSRTRLLVFVLPGADLGTVRAMMREEQLPHMHSICAIEEAAQFESAHGQGNYAFMRAMMCEQQTGEYDDFARYIPAQGSYADLDFDRPYFMTGPFFGERHIMQGRHYALLGTGEVNFRPMEGLTMINQWICHGKNSATVIYPPALREQIMADPRFDAYERSLERTSYASGEDAREMAHWLGQRLELKREVYGALIGRGDWDCVLVGVDEVHDAGHMLWHFEDREHPLHDPADEAANDSVRAVYRKADTFIGQLREIAGPVPVVLVGGPGMQANGSLNSYLDRILRVFEAEYLATGVCDDPYKRNHLFYAQYSDPSGGAVRFNLKGREPDGKVREADYAKLCQFLITRLEEIILLETGQPVIQEIYVTREKFGVARDSRLPDLICVWAPGSAYGTIYSERLGKIELAPDPDNVLDFRTGDHDGVAWMMMNESARRYFPADRVPAPHELGKYFRKIIERPLDGLD